MCTHNFLLTAIAKLHVKIGGEVFNRVYLSEEVSREANWDILLCLVAQSFADLLTYCLGHNKGCQNPLGWKYDKYLNNWVWQLQYVKNTSIMNFDFVLWSRIMLAYLLFDTEYINHATTVNFQFKEVFRFKEEFHCSQNFST